MRFNCRCRQTRMRWTVPHKRRREQVLSPQRPRHCCLRCRNGVAELRRGYATQESAPYGRQQRAGKYELSNSASPTGDYFEQGTNSWMERTMGARVGLGGSKPSGRQLRAIRTYYAPKFRHISTSEARCALHASRTLLLHSSFLLAANPALIMLFLRALTW